MRRLVFSFLLCVASSGSSAESSALTFEDIVARALGDATQFARAAELARLEREVVSTGRFTAEGATLEADLGPRREDDGAILADVSALVAFPMLSDRRTREDAASRLRDASPDIVTAEAIESRLRLRTAFLDAWLAQERLAVSEAQVATVEEVLTSVRKRVESGAEASYEVALVEGELLRSQSESDGARAARGDAWSRLRALADLPAEPLPLASPGMPGLGVPEDARTRFETGALRRSAERRRSLESAFLDLDRAQRDSRWSVVGTAGKEGHELFATLGAGYRFRHRGEGDALERERGAAVAALDRESAADLARLDTRFETARERMARFGTVTPADAFDDALAAVALRIELGKERASQALPVRRQILDARGAALERIRDAHVLIAEIESLTSGELP